MQNLLTVSNKTDADIGIQCEIDFLNNPLKHLGHNLEAKRKETMYVNANYYAVFLSINEEKMTPRVFYTSVHISLVKDDDVKAYYLSYNFDKASENIDLPHDVYAWFCKWIAQITDILHLTTFLLDEDKQIELLSQKFIQTSYIQLSAHLFAKCCSKFNSQTMPYDRVKEIHTESLKTCRSRLDPFVVYKDPQINAKMVL